MKCYICNNHMKHIGIKDSKIIGPADIYKCDICNEIVYRKKEVKPIIIESNQDTVIGNLNFSKGTKIYKCTCDNFVKYKDNYCNNCGAKLNWNKKE